MHLSSLRRETKQKPLWSQTDCKLSIHISTASPCLEEAGLPLFKDITMTSPEIATLQNTILQKTLKGHPRALSGELGSLSGQHWNSASGTSTLWSRAKNLSQDKMNGKGPEACQPVRRKQKCDPRPGRPSGWFSRATEGGTLILPSTHMEQIFKRMQNYQIILLKVIKIKMHKLAPGVMVFSLCVSAFILGPQATCMSHPQTPGLRLFQRGCLRSKQQVLK